MNMWVWIMCLMHSDDATSSITHSDSRIQYMWLNIQKYASRTVMTLIDKAQIRL